ncbi:MAG TPA: hypothetical protein VKT24_06950 [Rhizomicrobium sp.]|nr:hypothetical protein [Rhizomicrobium sp.]
MKFGDKVDPTAITHGAPPIVIQVQPTGYVKVNTPDEIRQFENMMHEVYGRKFALHSSMHFCETCSCGTDDCGAY